MPRVGLSLSIMVLALCDVGMAHSILFPAFRSIIPVRDKLVCVSPDYRALVCISNEGTELWRRECSALVSCFAWTGDSVLIQVDDTVFRVDAHTGAGSIFVTLGKNRRLCYDAENRVLYSKHASEAGASQGSGFCVLDEQGNERWANSEIVSVESSTEADLICLTGAVSGGINGALSDSVTSIICVDRSTGDKKWSLPIKQTNSIVVNVVRLAPYLLAKTSDRELLCIHEKSGEIEGRRDVAEGPGGQEGYPNRPEIISIGKSDSLFAYLQTDSRIPMSENTVHTLHLCSIPALREMRSIKLESLNISSFTFFRGFIITRSLGRVACFDSVTGRRIWWRHQMMITDPVGLEMYYSCGRKQGENWKVLLGIISVATGQERILYHETLPK